MHKLIGNGIAQCDRCNNLWDFEKLNHCPYCAYTQEQRPDWLRRNQKNRKEKR